MKTYQFMYYDRCLRLCQSTIRAQSLTEARVLFTHRHVPIHAIVSVDTLPEEAIYYEYSCQVLDSKQTHNISYLIKTPHTLTQEERQQCVNDQNLQLAKILKFDTLKGPILWRLSNKEALGMLEDNGMSPGNLPEWKPQ